MIEKTSSYKEWESDQYKVSVGEGSFGGDGVIQLTRKDTENLEWFLFLDNSNPFNTVKIEGDFVIAKNTSNISVTIPILKPERISISNSDKITSK